jgi:hypothetical protein
LCGVYDELRRLPSRYVSLTRDEVRSDSGESHVLALLAEKGGQVIAVVTYEVSADGNTLTSRSAGMVEQTIVFDRSR